LILGAPVEQQLQWHSADLNPARIITALQTLHFHVIPGVDKPENIVAAIQFFSSSMRVNIICFDES
jgi:hypothetical protein